MQPWGLQQGLQDSTCGFVNPNKFYIQPRSTLLNTDHHLDLRSLSRLQQSEQQCLIVRSVVVPLTAVCCIGMTSYLRVL